jgi:hypothetical protein
MILGNSRRVVLAPALAAGLVCASVGTILLAKQAKPGERVDIVLTTVKAGKQQQFEDYLTKFGAALEKAQQKDATTKRVATQTRTLRPAKPNEDGTFTYVFLMDPVIPDPDAYDMGTLLRKVLTEAEVEKLMEQLEDAVVGPQEVLELVQSK